MTAAEAVAAILSVYPLDTFVDDAAARMEIVGKPDEVPPVQREVQKAIDAAEGKRLADDRRRALRLLRARQAGLLRDPDRRAALLRLLRFPQGRRSAGCGASRMALASRSSSSASSSPTPPTAQRGRHAWARPSWAAASRSGPGGKGSNQAVAAGAAGRRRHLHHPPRPATPSPTWRWTTWTEAGVRPAVIATPESYTGAAYIFIEEGTGNNAIIVAPGRRRR